MHMEFTGDPTFDIEDNDGEIELAYNLSVEDGQPRITLLNHNDLDLTLPSAAQLLGKNEPSPQGGVFRIDEKEILETLRANFANINMPNEPYTGEPIEVRINANGAKGAAYRLEGKCDYVGGVKRTFESMTVTASDDGYISLNLHPGTYKLTQTVASFTRLLNSHVTTLSVGVSDCLIDGKPQREFKGLSSPKPARRYRAMIRQYGGEPFPNAKWRIEGEAAADPAAEFEGTFETTFTADENGVSRFSLPMGTFFMLRGIEPFDTIMSLIVSEESAAEDSIDIVTDAIRVVPDGRSRPRR